MQKSNRKREANCSCTILNDDEERAGKETKGEGNKYECPCTKILTTQQQQPRKAQSRSGSQARVVAHDRSTVLPGGGRAIPTTLAVRLAAADQHTTRAARVVVHIVSVPPVSRVQQSCIPSKEFAALKGLPRLQPESCRKGDTNCLRTHAWNGETCRTDNKGQREQGMHGNSQATGTVGKRDGVNLRRGTIKPQERKRNTNIPTQNILYQQQGSTV